MEVTRFTDDQGVEVFSLTGRLDTITSPQFHETLIAAIDGTADVAVDFSDLEYVSSAGLRVLLAAQKQSMKTGVSFEVRNPNEEILEIFDMTGFSDILTIA